MSPIVIYNFGKCTGSDLVEALLALGVGSREMRHALRQALRQALRHCARQDALVPCTRVRPRTRFWFPDQIDIDAVVDPSVPLQVEQKGIALD